MRTFLSLQNLYRALPVGLAATLMAVPRLQQGDIPFRIFFVTTFCVMMLTAGTVTAWGGSGGLYGAFPSRRRQLAATGVVLLLSLMLLPLRWLWLDPRIRAAIAAAGPGPLMDLAYPTSADGILAVFLWSAGFEALFFHAAPVALFARVTNRWWIGVIVGVALRAWASSQYLTHYGVTEQTPLIIANTVGGALVGCLIFARGGLLPAMLFGAGLGLHLLLPPR